MEGFCHAKGSDGTPGREADWTPERNGESVKAGATQSVQAPDDDLFDQASPHVGHELLPARSSHLGTGEGIGIPPSSVLAPGMGLHLGNLASDVRALGKKPGRNRQLLAGHVWMLPWCLHVVRWQHRKWFVKFRVNKTVDTQAA